MKFWSTWSWICISWIPLVSVVLRRDRQQINGDLMRQDSVNGYDICKSRLWILLQMRYTDLSKTPTGRKIISLHILRSNLDPMTYAFLYPYGETGMATKFGM